MPSDDLTSPRTIAWTVLRVNAFSSRDAVHAALADSEPWMFSESNPIAVSHTDEEAMLGKSPRQKARWGQAEAPARRPGAWEVEMSMVTLAHPGNGANIERSIGSHAVRFASATPHLDPHAEDRPEHWAAVRLALAEKEALAQSSPPPDSETPRNNHAL